MLARLDALPEPQQSALGVTFGLSAGDSPDRFAKLRISPCNGLRDVMPSRARDAALA
jgi:hypothetical protein